MAIDPEKFKKDPKKVSPEELAHALELLEKEDYRKARIKAGEIKGYGKWSDMTPEQKEKAREQARRLRAKQNLVIKWAQSQPAYKEPTAEAIAHEIKRMQAESAA